MRDVLCATKIFPHPELVEGRTAVLQRYFPTTFRTQANVTEIVGFVYMLRCRDGNYYVGSARGDWSALERRVSEHNAGAYDGYTKSRRPVELVFHQEFQQITDAITAERQLKGWNRAKKEALIRGDWDLISRLARNYTEYPRSSTKA